jgi:predicted outer membrane protein
MSQASRLRVFVRFAFWRRISNALAAHKSKRRVGFGSPWRNREVQAVRSLIARVCQLQPSLALGVPPSVFQIRRVKAMQLHSWKLWATSAAAVLVSLSAADLLAQERPRAQDPASRTADQTIAQCLGIGNQEEIALATLAASKTQNPQVKQFAETLVKDHGRFLSRLEPFGAQKIELARRGGEALDRERPRTAPARPAERRGEVAEREGAPSRQTAAREQGLDFLDVKRQMAQKCLAAAERQWAEHQGAEADQCFVGGQLVLHQQMLDAQQVLKQYASPELQAVIQEGIATTQTHLDHAKNLMKELVAAGGGRTQPRAVE